VGSGQTGAGASVGRQQSTYGRRSDGPEGIERDRVELRLVDGEQMDAEPAAVPDVRRPEEPVRFGLEKLRLDAVGGGTPDREPTVLVVVVQEHHEALLVADEEGGPSVAGPLGRLRQAEAGGPDHGQGALDIRVCVVDHVGILPSRPVPRPHAGRATRTTGLANGGGNGPRGPHSDDRAGMRVEPGLRADGRTARPAGWLGWLGCWTWEPSTD